LYSENIGIRACCIVVLAAAVMAGDDAIQFVEKAETIHGHGHSPLSVARSPDDERFYFLLFSSNVH
jgi:hypothetical protein